jgi:hypothetical protein
MCDWTAPELLSSWSNQTLPDLERLGVVDFREAEDGSKAILQLKGDALVASITAWSTGMLELISRATDGGPSTDPEVITEQRHARGQAVAVLDDWLQRLLRPPVALSASPAAP